MKKKLKNTTKPQHDAKLPVMRCSKKDYNEYALLWTVYRFLIDTCQVTGWELEHFVEAYGLDSEIAQYVAKCEDVEILNIA